ncbi:Plant self-incompatibility S1 [Corchorus olitorius]|uniref:S-protein homolog n=1 Tax=Corchorus olitorius TaxID=93759 RepID=A0A1R3KUD1_9ROSI|nr:Plant self-incompatibility S1 [Corchorus olitorius]
MNSSYVNLLILFLVLGPNQHVEAEGFPSEFKTWHVYVVNELSNNKSLFLHCKSKDDDLGIQNLSPGANFTWSFQRNMLRTTLFWCYMSKEGNAHAALKVFWQDVLLFHKCLWKSCIWSAKDDGIYLKDFVKNYDEFRLQWEPGL